VGHEINHANKSQTRRRLLPSEVSEMSFLSEEGSQESSQGNNQSRGLESASSASGLDAGVAAASAGDGASGGAGGTRAIDVAALILVIDGDVDNSVGALAELVHSIGGCSLVDGVSTSKLLVGQGDRSGVAAAVS